MVELNITWNGVKGTYKIEGWTVEETQLNVLTAVAEKRMLMLPQGTMIGYLMLANSLVSASEAKDTAAKA